MSIAHSGNEGLDSFKREIFDGILTILVNPESNAQQRDTACQQLAVHTHHSPSMTYISEQLKSALVGSQELREWFRSNCRVTDSVDGYSTSTNPRLLLIALGGDAFVNAVNAARVDGSLIDVRIAAPLPAPSGVKVEGTTAVRIVKPNLGHKSVK